MRKALSGIIAPALIVALIVVCSAARPFEALPLEDGAYANLATVAAAGLLCGMELPAGELSRLEAAVLTQRALAAYGAAQLEGGAADPVAEAALSGLCVGLAEELAALGSAPATAMPRPATTDTSLLERIEYLEAELDDEAEAELDEEEAEEPAAEPEADDAAIEVALYGDFYLQASAGSTELEPAAELADTSEDSTSLDLYWGELGVDATDGAWSAHASIALADEDDSAQLYEAYGRYDNPRNGWYFQIGQAILPFGNNDYCFPTYPAVNDLGFTRAKVIGGGYEAEDWGFSAHAFSPKLAVEGEDSEVKDFSAVWTMAQREADACQDGYKLRAGYTSYLGCHDIRLTGTETCQTRAAAFNVFGRYDWRGNQYHLLADYTAAAERFDVLDLDANGDEVGDQPSALNMEFVYEPCPDNLWGVNYQITEEFDGYAANRFGVLYGQRLSPMTLLKLEYSHGEYDADFASIDADDRLVAEFNLAF